jgi:hypothetical protein
MKKLPREAKRVAHGGGGSCVVAFAVVPDCLTSLQNTLDRLQTVWHGMHIHRGPNATLKQLPTTTTTTMVCLNPPCVLAPLPPPPPVFTQACKFRDDYAAFQDVGAAVYGISSDSPAANKAFAEAQRLPFPLLTDPAGALRKVGGSKCGWETGGGVKGRGGEGQGLCRVTAAAVPTAH